MLGRIWGETEARASAFARYVWAKRKTPNGVIPDPYTFGFLAAPSPMVSEDAAFGLGGQVSAGPLLFSLPALSQHIQSMVGKNIGKLIRENMSEPQRIVTLCQQIGIATL